MEGMDSISLAIYLGIAANVVLVLLVLGIFVAWIATEWERYKNGEESIFFKDGDRGEKSEAKNFKEDSSEEKHDEQ